MVAPYRGSSLAVLPCYGTALAASFITGFPNANAATSNFFLSLLFRFAKSTRIRIDRDTPLRETEIED